MTSNRAVALASGLLMVLLLVLRPLVGGMGAPPSEAAVPLLPAPRPAAVGSATPAPPAVATHRLAAVAAAVLAATNRERLRAKLAPLAAEERLAEIAAIHSDDMLTRGFFDHVNPDGDGPHERVTRGHRRMIGTSAENLWMGSGYAGVDETALAEQIVRSWMGSQGHRENILRPGLTHLGVGVSGAGEELRATQLFGAVWGYLDEPLPPVLRAGVSPRLASHPYRGEPAAEQVDLFADGRRRWGPRPVTIARFDVEPGSYLVRFYFPRPGGFLITYGPGLTVAP
jgi:uncharacterized protein YkwD